MGRFLFVLLLFFIVISAACIGSSGRDTTPTTPASSGLQESTTETTDSTSVPAQTTSIPQEPETWNVTLVWNISTVGVPFMDLSPDGSLAAAIDWNRGIIYLVKPSGERVSFNVQEGDAVQPVISGVALKGGVAYVLASYEEFAGVRKYSWGGLVGEEKHGWSGSVSDQVLRSPSGNHLCYLVTTEATTQELYCDGTKTTLENAGDYSLISVSDTGVVVLTRGDTAFIFKEGSKVLSLNTSSVIAYGDRLVASEDGYLEIYDLNGNLLAEKEGYTFKQTTLLRWTLLPTGKYLFRNEPLEDTSVLTWNLTGMRTLPGFPEFANENFVVMRKDDLLICYSLKDFHEVFRIEAPGGDGLVKLSDDGKVMLVSGEFGSYWLYRASLPEEES